MAKRTTNKKAKKILVDLLRINQDGEVFWLNFISIKSSTVKYSKSTYLGHLDCPEMVLKVKRKLGKA